MCKQRLSRTSLAGQQSTAMRLVLEVALLGALFQPIPQLATAEETSVPRRNLVYIMTDQQHAGMMSCTGNKYLQTPAMDSLAAQGVRFERAYASNPVCIPSRLGMMTGRMPSYFGVTSNRPRPTPMPAEALQQSLGWTFRNAGYETVFGGKTHWPRGMNLQTIGFEPLTPDERDGLAEACVQFLKRPHEKPFLLVASFINPHDICFLAIDDFTRATQQPRMYPQCTVERETLAKAAQLPANVSRDEFFRELCPLLPANYEVPPEEPACIAAKYLGKSFREFARRTWSDEQWRLHRWAYCRLTEAVDQQIGKLLTALRETGLAENTVVVFSSDHGDLDAAHRLEHKSILYEESVRVPFIVSGPQVTRAGLVDDRHLVAAGIDLFPTLCDFAGVTPPANLPGSSVKALAEGREPSSWREFVVAESDFGRMVRTERYKYVVYDSGANREQLVDLRNDPGEMRNLAQDPSAQSVLQEHRQRLQQWVREVEDRVAGEYLVP
jgi:choline-sulfatase